MPNLITDLIVNRVDLVGEGANSAAFITLFKRKEPKSMTVEEILSELSPEHSEVLKAKIAEGDKAITDLETATNNLTAANDELAKAKEKLPCECDGEADENGVCKVCGRKKTMKAKESMQFDETETLKSLPEGLRSYVETMKAKADIAEEQLRKANEKKIEEDAVAKAATLKSLPIEQTKLVTVLKSASKEVIDVLVAANAAVETAVLGEVGKSATTTPAGATDSNVAWGKIETEADQMMKSAGSTLTKAQAIARVIKEKPELYRDYLNGGAE